MSSSRSWPAVGGTTVSLLAGRQLGPLVVRWRSGSVVLTECINGDGAVEGRQSGAAGTSGVVEDRYKTVISQQNEPLLGPRVEVAERVDRLMQQCHLRDRSAGRSQQVHGVACELSTGPAARSSSLVSHGDILPLRDCTASGEVQSSCSTSLASPTALSHYTIGSPTWCTCSPRSHNRSSDAPVVTAAKVPRGLPPRFSAWSGHHHLDATLPSHYLTRAASASVERPANEDSGVSFQVEAPHHPPTPRRVGQAALTIFPSTDRSPNRPAVVRCPAATLQHPDHRCAAMLRPTATARSSDVVVNLR